MRTGAYGKSRMTVLRTVSLISNTFASRSVYIQLYYALWSKVSRTRSSNLCNKPSNSKQKTTNSMRLWERYPKGEMDILGSRIQRKRNKNRDCVGLKISRCDYRQQPEIQQKASLRYSVGIILILSGRLSPQWSRNRATSSRMAILFWAKYALLPDTDQSRMLQQTEALTRQKRKWWRNPTWERMRTLEIARDTKAPSLPPRKEPENLALDMAPLDNPKVMLALWMEKIISITREITIYTGKSKKNGGEGIYMENVQCRLKVSSWTVLLILLWRMRCDDPYDGMSSRNLSDEIPIRTSSSRDTSHTKSAKKRASNPRAINTYGRTRKPKENVPRWSGGNSEEYAEARQRNSGSFDIIWDCRKMLYATNF